MSGQHSIACGRRIVRELEQGGGSKWQAAQAIRAHCGVSLLRAHRVAHKLTLSEVARQLQDLLAERGAAGAGLSHQSVSRWETGSDMPSYQFLDALCQLYRTRPDRLGFGNDYSDRRYPVRVRLVNPACAAPAFDAAGARNRSSMAEALQSLEEGLDLSGYLVYVLPPSEFIPARMRDLAQVQQLILSDPGTETQRRLRRVEAILAGLIAFRLNDIADIHDTFMWAHKSRRAARQSGYPGVEAWLLGHLAHGHECYRHALDRGLSMARTAQAVSGTAPNPGRVFGLLAEGGIQARVGRSREALDAITTAERLFDVLPVTDRTDNNLGTSEYILRWHQSHALSSMDDWRGAEEIRKRMLELPMAAKDEVGRALLDLDLAASLQRRGESEQASALIRDVWHALPAELRAGQVRRNVAQLVTGFSATVRDTIFEPN
ncbi:helix-turn-helix domain-containing protein [Nocardia sp. NPDC127579]|uniref:helix-turn-helix domain-containing protein n=1 Tax=Nocardia sp. NPDC127579 TaxID=3345402 RepID=UPI00362D2717